MRRGMRRGITKEEERNTHSDDSDVETLKLGGCDFLFFVKYR